MGQKRRKFDVNQKVKILREHLIDRFPLSQVCDRYGIAPTQFYQWQKQFFENGAASFEAAGKAKDRREKKLQQQIDKLQEKISHKDEVIAELVEHNIDLKKKHGQA
jgi:transposase